MANPLFDKFNQQPANQNPFGNMMNMLQQFNQFKSTFRGDPKQKVQELLNSGQMSQQQFQQLSAMAEQFQKMMK